MLVKAARGGGGPTKDEEAAEATRGEAGDRQGQDQSATVCETF